MRQAIILILFVAITASVSGQMTVGELEKKDTLFSTILNEKRPLRIYLPDDYKKDSIRYPVIYLLDGEWRFVHGTSTVRFLSAEGFMPNAIVVGIPNVARERDLLPDKGADLYRDFIIKELIPSIEKQYRADTFRILIGHSYGGVFAMHMLTTRPQVFSGYIMIDPAFSYQNRMMIQNSAKFLSQQKSLAKSVYISGNEGAAWKNMSVEAIDSVLKADAPADLLWKTYAYANETHVSVAFKTIYDGLRFIFQDYRKNIGQIIPHNGMFVPGKPYDVLVTSDISALYYTTNGTNPTKQSPQITMDPSTHFAMLPVKEPSVVKISTASAFAGATIGSANFVEAQPMEPVKKPGKIMQGIRYKAYAGTWEKLPDFSTLKPYASGTLSNFVMPDSTIKTGFGVQYTGYIKATEEGYYDLAISSNDGSRLYVNDKMLIDLDGIHNSDDMKVYRVYLKAGYHQIRVDYFNKGGDPSLVMEFLKYPWTLQQVDMKISEQDLFCKEQ
jgi:predicted alpha/beta superfamily hydrolase